MFVALALCVLAQGADDHAVSGAVDDVEVVDENDKDNGADADGTADVSGAITLDFPVGLAAQSTASKNDTVLSSWLGVRAGYISSTGGGVFFGGDGALLLGGEGGGTAQVSVARSPIAVEGRGLVGGRFRGGLFGVGGYGYGGVLVGGGAVVLTAFDELRTRPFVTAAGRVGGGMELSFSSAALRIELGAGLRDLRPELHGQVALGARF